MGFVSGGVLRKKVEDNSTGVLKQVIADGAAIVEFGVVADHMDHPIGPQLPTQVVEVGHEERRVALLSWSRQQQPSCPPVKRSSQMPFFVVAWRDDLGLLAATHPHRPDLGVQMDIHFVLGTQRSRWPAVVR